jgi:short-subunit dehydrogenase
MGAFAGQVVWITGASSGIGEAMAREFWSEGADLVLSARRGEELERVKASLQDIPGRRCMILPMDVTDTDSMTGLVQKVREEFGRVDVLVNNAGVSQRSWAAETSLEVDRRIMEVNFFGTVALTKGVLPLMLERRSGQIVVISSVAGKFGFYLRSAYSASKHALHGFFESLRMEVHKEGVRVMLVCPGKVLTPISVNALTADGTPHNVMDEGQRQGVPADVCAKRIVRGAVRGEYEVYIAGREMQGIWMKRFFPRLFTRMIRRQKPE